MEDGGGGGEPGYNINLFRPRFQSPSIFEFISPIEFVMDVDKASAWARHDIDASEILTYQKYRHITDNLVPSPTLCERDDESQN